MKKAVFLILTFGVISSNAFARGEPLTKDDFKLFVEQINKRFEDINKRFEMIDKRFEDMNKRFDDLRSDLYVGLSALAAFTLVLFGFLKWSLERMEKRFEERFESIEKHFERVDTLLLLLVKAHEDVIGSEAVDVAMGRIGLKELSDKIIEDVKTKHFEKQKELIKEVVMNEIFSDEKFIKRLAEKIKQIGKVA